MKVHRIDTDYANADPHETIRDAMNTLPADTQAIAIFAIDSRGRLMERSSGFEHQALLWALEMAKLRVLMDE